MTCSGSAKLRHLLAEFINFKWSQQADARLTVSICWSGQRFSSQSYEISLLLSNAQGKHFGGNEDILP